MSRLPPKKIERLADDFGQWTLLVSCKCGHYRRVFPRTLAALSGWDARIGELIARMRCSKFGKRGGCQYRIHAADTNKASP